MQSCLGHFFGDPKLNVEARFGRDTHLSVKSFRFDMLFLHIRMEHLILCIKEHLTQGALEVSEM